MRKRRTASPTMSGWPNIPILDDDWEDEPLCFDVSATGSPNFTPSSGFNQPGQIHTNLTECQKDLEHTKQILAVQTNHALALQHKVNTLQQELRKSHSDLRHENNILSRELADAQASQSLSIEAQLAEANYYFNNCGPRVELLRAYDQALAEVEYQKGEAQKWRAEAYCQGSKTVNACLQAAVDEGVRKKRHQDAFLIKNLHVQISALEAAKGGEIARRMEAECSLEEFRQDRRSSSGSDSSGHGDGGPVVDSGMEWWLNQCMADQIEVLEEEKAVEVAKRRDLERALDGIRRDGLGMVAESNESSLVLSLRAEIALLRAANSPKSDKHMDIEWRKAC